MKIHRLILSAISCIVFYSSCTGAVTFESPAEQVGLLELYTSEGCSSCPSADRWLSTLKDEDGLWDEFIPIAFHVDYWDYIGWKDRFATPQNSNRQRQYAREQSLKTVYTPGFLYNGQEWRGWFVRRYMDLPEGGNPGELKLDISDNFARARYSPQESSNDHLVLNVALLGFDLNSQVTAGENRGRELPHDFVMLGLETVNLKLRDGYYETETALPTSHITAPSYGIVAWVSKHGRQAPLQATGGWMPDRSNASALDLADRPN